MKNKIIKSTLLGLLPIICLISCNNNSRFKEIVDDEEAFNVINGIVTRENEETFKQPSWFTYKYNYSCQTNYKLYETGITQTDTKISDEFYFNLDDLVLKEVNEIHEKDSYMRIETYLYFDESKNELVTLTNSNGKKTKTKKSVANKDYAIIKFRNTRDEYSLINDINLIDYQEELINLREQQKSLVDQKDQYIKIFHGSNDEKSIQMITETKLKTSEDRPLLDKSYTLSGYEITNSNYIYRNDLTDSKTTTYSKELKNDDYGFYIKDNIKSETKYIYKKIKITLPNVDEYKEQA